MAAGTFKLYGTARQAGLAIRPLLCYAVMCQDSVQAPTAFMALCDPLLHGALSLPLFYGRPFLLLPASRQQPLGVPLCLRPSAGPRQHRRSASWGRSAASASRPASQPAPAVKRVADVRDPTDGQLMVSLRTLTATWQLFDNLTQPRVSHRGQRRCEAKATCAVEMF